MATFVLVHGALCWERLIPEVEALGHQAIAVDLPIDDPAAGLAEYAEVVARLVPDESAPDDERAAIVCAEDRLVGIDWARRRIPELVGVSPIELPGGHSPFLSRPAALAAALVAGLEPR